MHVLRPSSPGVFTVTVPGEKPRSETVQTHPDPDSATPKYRASFNLISSGSVGKCFLVMGVRPLELVFPPRLNAFQFHFFFSPEKLYFGAIT